MKNGNRFILPSLFLVPIVAGIIFLDLGGAFNYTDAPFLIAFIIYIIFVMVQRLQSKPTFTVALLFLIYTGLSYIPTGASRVTERFGEWFYLFFLLGLIQYTWEVWHNKRE